MLITKEKICGKIRYASGKIVFDKKKSDTLLSIIYEQFGIPTGLAMDYIVKRRNLEDANTFMLFALLYGIDKVNNGHAITDCFTEPEIKMYSEMRYEPDTITFPIEFDCIQVAADQWIGECNAKTLMQLRDAQLINYNKNTQRTLQRVVRGDGEFFRIALNYSAVDSIEKSFNNNTFIPNTITLNIPEDEFGYEYNKKEKKLIVNEISMFDITDGYHRFLAMTRIYDKDETFDYPMEIRITHFPENKTKQFIYQEDQKTKMRKIDSDSMNMQNLANIFTERINTEITFNWNGEIARSETRINFAEFATLVDYFYFKGKKVDNKMVYSLVKDLVPKLNAIIDSNDKLMTDRVTSTQLLIIFYCLTQFEDINKVIEHVNNGFSNIEKLKEVPGFNPVKPRRGIYKYLDEII